MADAARPATAADVQDALIDTTAGKMTKVQASYKVAMDIWIGRFREAQAKIRELEAELDKSETTTGKVMARYADALERLPEDDLVEHQKAVQAMSAPTAPKLLPILEQAKTGGCGSGCGCS